MPLISGDPPSKKTDRRFPAVSWGRENELLQDAAAIVGRSVTPEISQIVARAQRRFSAPFKWDTNKVAVERVTAALDRAEWLRKYIRGPNIPQDAVLRTATDNRWQASIPDPWQWSAQPTGPDFEALADELDKFIEWAKTTVAVDITGKKHIAVDVDHAGSLQRALCGDCAALLLGAGKDGLQSSAHGNLARLTACAWELLTGNYSNCAGVADSVAQQYRASAKVGK
jgi:hypothetical protein